MERERQKQRDRGIVLDRERACKVVNRTVRLNGNRSYQQYQGLTGGVLWDGLA